MIIRPNIPEGPIPEGVSGAAGRSQSHRPDTRASDADIEANAARPMVANQGPTLSRMAARTKESYLALLRAATSSTEEPLALHQAALIEVDDLFARLRAVVNDEDEASPELHAKTLQQLERAVHAAADTGLHALGWSQTQVQTFLQTYAPVPEKLSVRQLKATPARCVATWHAKRAPARPTTEVPQGTLAPPSVRKEPKVRFSGDGGACLIDPYAWLDTRTPESDTVFEERVAYTRQVLGNLRGSQRLQQLFSKVRQETPAQITKFQQHGDHCFYLRQSKDDNYPVLCQRPRLANGEWGEEQELLNPANSDWGELAQKSIYQYEPLSNGRFIMLRVAGDDETSVVRYLDTTNQRLLDDRIERQWGGYGACPDDEHVIVTQLPVIPENTPPAEIRRGGCMVLHKRGTSAENDIRIFGPGVRADIDVADNENPLPVMQGDFVFAQSNTANTRAELILHFAHRDEVINAQRAEDITWHKVADVADGVRAYAVWGDHIYLATHGGLDEEKKSRYPRYRVVRISLRELEKPAALRKKPEEVLPEQPDVVIGLHATKEALYVHTSWPDGDRLLCLASKDQAAPEEVELPFKGFAAEIHADSASPHLMVKLQSPIESPRIYTHRPGTAIANTGLQEAYAKQFPNVRWEIKWVTKEDGTRVPFSMTYDPKKLRSSQLEVYAAYDIYSWFYGKSGPDKKGFDPQVLEQIDEFGLVDIHAYVEGGGVLGHDWYLQGLGANKPVAWNSLHHVGEEIKALGIPKPVVSVVSAGGLLAPGVVQRPDLFAALMFDVAMLDGTSFNTVSPIAPFNVHIVGGTPKTAEGFNTIKDIHLYPNNLPFGKLMCMLGVTGMSDARVFPGQTLKTVALAQAKNTGDAPILLFATDGGHIIPDLERRDARAVVSQTFVLWAGGHPDFQLAV
ncbi:MAG TPA: prolyl oligopeptidase family serine peptidase [Noviherbaspirillum sp.]|nr:prolyl oligopeptidase family serine peptidase [Noviherbaspirillum sp.]